MFQCVLPLNINVVNGIFKIVQISQITQIKIIAQLSRKFSQNKEQTVLDN
jgi:hypothetical protein